MNSVIIPHLPSAVSSSYHTSTMKCYYPQQPLTASRPQQGYQHTTPTDLFAVSAMVGGGVPQQQFSAADPKYLQKYDFQRPQPQQRLVPSTPQQTQPLNLAPKVRLTSSSRPDLTKCDLTKRLFVDCSIEYDLPNVPKITSKDGKVEPILMLHPAYTTHPAAHPAYTTTKPKQQQIRQQQQPPPIYMCNIRDCQCRMMQQQPHQFMQRKAVKRPYVDAAGSAFAAAAMFATTTTTNNQRSRYAELQQINSQGKTERKAE
jgi:hypothetical protein